MIALVLIVVATIALFVGLITGKSWLLYLSAAGFAVCAAIDTAVLYNATQSKFWRYQVENVALWPTVVVAVLAVAAILAARFGAERGADHN